MSWSNKSSVRPGISLQYILVRVYPETEVVRLVQIKLEIDPIGSSLIHTPLDKSAAPSVAPYDVDLAKAYWISIQIDWLGLHTCLLKWSSYISEFIVLGIFPLFAK